MLAGELEDFGSGASGGLLQKTKQSSNKANLSCSLYTARSSARQHFHSKAAECCNGRLPTHAVIKWGGGCLLNGIAP